MIAYAGSAGRLHYGEQGDKGFLLWEIGAEAARYAPVATPARRTIDILFDGMPDMGQLRQIVRETDIDGAFVRGRWAVPEEDVGTIDRAAIERLFAGATQVRLVGRVIPVVRTRAAGISSLADMTAKVRAWSDVIDAKVEPLLACLETLHRQAPEEIAGAILAQSLPADPASPATKDAVEQF